MSDERQDSIRQGMATPEESEIGRKAAEQRRRQFAEGPQIGGGMGGTSDSDSAGDEARAHEAEWAAEREAEKQQAGGDEPA